MLKQKKNTNDLSKQSQIANKAIKEFLESNSVFSPDDLNRLHEIKAYVRMLEAKNRNIVSHKSDTISHIGNDSEYRHIFEFSDIGNSITLLSGEVNVNHAFSEMLGYTKEELISKKWQEITHPDDVGYTQEMIDFLFSGEKERLRFNKRFIHKDGSVVWTEIGSCIRSDSEGRPLYLMTNITNITKRKQIEDELKDSRERYKNLIELAVDGILLGSNKGYIIDANSHICSMFGRSREEIVGRHISDSIFSPESLKKVPLRFDKLNEGEVVINERVILRPDGTEIAIEMRSKMMPDGTYQSIYRDISKWKNDQQRLNDVNEDLEKLVVERTNELYGADNAMQQTRINYETFFNSINEFLFVVDEMGNIIHANDRVIDRLGYTIDGLIGKPICLLYTKDYKEGTNKSINELLACFTDNSYTLLYPKSGTPIYVESRISYGVWNNKTVIFIVTKDVSEIKLSEEKFSTFFNINPSACGLSDPDTGQYIEVNDAFCDLLGFTKEEVIGKTVFELGILSFEQRNSLLKDADKNRKIVNAEVDLIAKDGSEKHVLLSAEMIDIHAKTFRYTSVYDITERVHAEAMLKDIIDKNPLSIQIVDKEGYTIQVNNAHTKLFGMCPPPDYSVFADPQLQTKEFVELVEQLRNGEVVYFPDSYFNVYQINPDFPNIPVWVNVVAFPLYGKGADLDRFVIMHENITDRKLAEIASIESEKKYQTLFENVHDVFYKVSPDGILLEISPSINKLGDYTFDELIGTSVFELYENKEDRDVFLEAIRKKGEVVDYEVLLRDRKSVV